MSFTGRDSIVDYLGRMLVGPADGFEEVVAGLPTKRYLMGILYPRSESADVALADEEADSPGGSEGELTAEDPIALAGQWLPSSLGLSLFVNDPDKVRCRVWGARYERETGEDRTRRWVRRPIAEDTDPEEHALRTNGDPVTVLDGHGELRVRARTVGGGTLLTVSLLNAEKATEQTESDPSRCLFQAGLEVYAGNCNLREYPSIALLTRDPEEQELRLLHREAKTFAIGHGCAVDWYGDGVDRKDGARSVQVPSHVVHGVTQIAPEGLDGSILDVARLGSEDFEWETLRAELTAFVDSYGVWVSRQSDRDDVPTALEPARGRIVERLHVARRRMLEGIELLDGDATAREAFRLANRALAIQNVRQQSDLGGTRRIRGEAPAPMEIDLAKSNFKWYPFQLAFQLLVLPSLVDPENADRDVVDLIWFPTGGGKTEAYLAVAATEIFLRRLREPEHGGGTAVLTRYTLRLLTTQQFQRAAATICACEKLRRADGRLGTEPISIGLWVGKSLTPNSCASAIEQFEEIREADEADNPFQLEICPWCGTELIPRRASEDDADYGVRADLENFQFFCPEVRCPFHEGLPVQVVDEVLYRKPPTMLLGTVDKFARLAWETQGGAFFGNRGHNQPPSLIIQDELHLLSGPLGTTVGVYEAAIGALCARDGVLPKIVASTATIRRSEDQVRGLFAGRPVRLFPPSGVDARDSFFARIDFDTPGRLYVGAMAQGHTVPTAVIHVCAALLQAVHELPMSEDERDAYWTLVAYHNSLRELGGTMTYARDDIPARMEGIASGDLEARELRHESVVQLTGGASGISTILEQMKSHLGEDDVISMLVCTNMLSVGVDVSRLGLMLVNGQPKTTSEYIQATSRVGRGQVPGLVVTLYAATKPRDRSHYEAFRPYHESLYRHVEPTSVTPWSTASRVRSLHAAFLILVRHLGGLEDNASASSFNPADETVAKARSIVLDAIESSEPEERLGAEHQLDLLVNEWVDRIQDAADSGQTLFFKPAGRGVKSLLKNFGDRQPGWETLNSMRNVDRECAVRVGREG